MSLKFLIFILSRIAVCLEKNGILFADRALFCIAEVLALLARQRGGLRSGPAGNIAFANCIQHIHDVISLNVVALVFSSRNYLLATAVDAFSRAI